MNRIPEVLLQADAPKVELSDSLVTIRTFARGLLNKLSKHSLGKIK
jgi:hypothetical protein